MLNNLSIIPPPLPPAPPSPLCDPGNAALKPFTQKDNSQP